ncbi:MAG: peptide chain release factor 1 [Candidatus Moranbacteria bacterium]|jgi:peptide chain release factor 1|nr:peptide chain release factor 1 [Candidatus Moranbacteria bacterium]NCA94071.1 peptide chain release factor 1 [Sphingobacteriia bacterium]
MLEQIKKIKAEFKELEENLNSPEMLSNPSRLADLGKRKAELEKIISLIDRLEKTEREMRENGEIINSEEDDEMKTLALEANTQLSKEKEGLDKELELELIPKDPDDNKNSIIEIRAGAGGDEAALFAGTLFKMYSRYAEKNNWSISILNSHTTGIGGYKEIVFNLTSSDSQNPVYKKMKYESGVHRVQRIPETEKSGRIHTSTATVAVLSEAEEVDIKIDPKDLRIDTFASSGPGGQSVNTTMSAVRITHLPTGIVASCQDEKSQHKNKDRAMKVLRSRLVQIQKEEEAKKLGDARLSQIGTGDRSEKIRTYNFPQDRITDHRIKVSWSNMENILSGEIDSIINNLQEEDIKKKLALKK